MATVSRDALSEREVKKVEASEGKERGDTPIAYFGKDTVAPHKAAVYCLVISKHIFPIEIVYTKYSLQFELI
jgi:hypothetical protein